MCPGYVVFSEWSFFSQSWQLKGATLYVPHQVSSISTTCSLLESSENFDGGDDGDVAVVVVLKLTSCTEQVTTPELPMSEC